MSDDRELFRQESSRYTPRQATLAELAREAQAAEPAPRSPVRFRPDDGGWPTDADAAPDLPEDDEECKHVWERVGCNPTWGDQYECTQCGDMSP